MSELTIRYHNAMITLSGKSSQFKKIIIALAMLGSQQTKNVKFMRPNFILILSTIYLSAFVYWDKYCATKSGIDIEDKK